jgi:hypothetical protein
MSPSVNNSGGDKRHDVSDHGGGNDHLSLSQHHTQGFERFEVQWVLGLWRLGALSMWRLLRKKEPFEGGP